MRIPEKEETISIPPVQKNELQIRTDSFVIDGKARSVINTYWNDSQLLIDSHHLGSDEGYTIFKAELLAILIALKTTFRK